MLGPILTGAVLGALLVFVAHRRGGRGELQILAVGLLVAALIYLVLTAFRGDGSGLALEAAAVVLYGGLAWAGVRAPVWLALGWLAHVAWDLGIHLERAQPVVQAWYPLGCVGFDLVVAGFVLRVALSRSDGTR